MEIKELASFVVHLVEQNALRFDHAFVETWDKIVESDKENVDNGTDKPDEPVTIQPGNPASGQPGAVAGVNTGESVPNPSTGSKPAS